MGCLTAEQIKGFGTLRRECVEVPEWGEGAEVYVREMGKTEFRVFHKKHYNTGKDGIPREKADVDVELALVLRCTVDDKGENVFKDSDAEWLGERGFGAIQRIAEAVLDLHGLGAKAKN